MDDLWEKIEKHSYSVSKTGKIRNDRTGRILKPNVTCGYEQVRLYEDYKKSYQLVHRLVAEAFIENPHNKPEVNHKDGDKTNNFAENLEWCTNKYNINYGKGREKQARALRGKAHTEEHNRKIGESLKLFYKQKTERKNHEADR